MPNDMNTMLSRNGGAAMLPRADIAQPVQYDGYANDMAAMQPAENAAAMMRARDGPVQEPEPEEKTIGGPEPDPVQMPEPVKPPVAATPKQVPAKPQQPAKPKAAPPPQAKGAVAPAAIPKISYSMTPDQLCQEYIKLFRDTLGLELSTAICYENMRKLCEIDTKDPTGTLYFLENTYRVSTLIYLAGNLPITFVASVLAEKNRKNILKYVTIEVENGHKPYADVLDLRVRRWARKYDGMAVNDAMTVTPGATSLTPDLAKRMGDMLQDVSSKLRKFNKEMTSIVSKFDDEARNDITYIYSNWWYLLQGFENVPEMRTYIMAVTDDTRRNLKI